MGNVEKDYTDPAPQDEDLDSQLETTGETVPEDTSKESAPKEITDPKESDPKAKEEEGLKKALLDTKSAYTKATMELAELKGRLAVLEKKPEAPVKDWLDDYEEDALRLNPELAKDMIRKHREEVVQVLRERDQYWEGQFKTLDPDVLTMKEQIAELRQDSDYQGFSDKQLTVIAKKNKAAMFEPEEEEVVRSPGAPAGGRGSAGKSGKVVDIRESALYKQIYGG